MNYHLNSNLKKHEIGSLVLTLLIPVLLILLLLVACADSGINGNGNDNGVNNGNNSPNNSCNGVNNCNNYGGGGNSYPSGNSQPNGGQQKIQSFQCPGVDQVSNWMNVSVNKVTPNTDSCAFTAGNNGQTLSGVICTTQSGGTTIEYNTFDTPKTLIVKVCDGGTLPQLYGFTIRFISGYPSSGHYSADVCTIAQKARNGPAPIPSDWIVQPQANC